MNQITSRMQALRLALRERFGPQYDRRACARRAGIAERAWAGYERGENMPPVDAAIAIARALGVTAEQLGFERRPTAVWRARPTSLSHDRSGSPSHS